LERQLVFIISKIIHILKSYTSLKIHSYFISDTAKVPLVEGIGFSIQYITFSIWFKIKKSSPENGIVTMWYDILGTSLPSFVILNSIKTAALPITTKKCNNLL